MTRPTWRFFGASLLAVAVTVVAGCGESNKTTISIDGSSTVFPVSQAVAEEFENVNPGVQVIVGLSGTGGGFKKFVVGETDINDASRPIVADEIQTAKANGIAYIDLQVGIDGISVVVNPENDWVDCLSVEQLKEIWKPESTVHKWSDVKPEWPDEEIRLFGPDVDSGTFDYFTEAIVGKEGASRTDYEPNTDDNVLVTGVAGERYSLGYFGFAYYVENQDRLKALGISPAPEPTEETCVKPTRETIEAGQYVPLSRPLFLYVRRKALARPEVAKFLQFYLDKGQDLVQEVGYIRLSSEVLAEQRATLEQAIQQAQSGTETARAQE